MTFELPRSFTQSPDNNVKTINYNIDLENLRIALNNLVPVGSMGAYGGTTAPTGWLLCDGTSYVRTEYPELFTSIGTAYGTADGTHFNVPDFRGRFLRGVDDGEGTDPDAAGRTAMTTGGATGDAVGSVQADAVQGHFHNLFFQASELPGYVNAAVNTGSAINVPRGSTGADYTVGNPLTDGVNGTPRTTSETRSKNAYVNYIIRF